MRNSSSGSETVVRMQAIALHMPRTTDVRTKFGCGGIDAFRASRSSAGKGCRRIPTRSRCGKMRKRSVAAPGRAGSCPRVVRRRGKACTMKECRPEQPREGFLVFVSTNSLCRLTIPVDVLNFKSFWYTADLLGLWNRSLVSKSNENPSSMYTLLHTRVWTIAARPRAQASFGCRARGCLTRSQTEKEEIRNDRRQSSRSSSQSTD